MKLFNIEEIAIYPDKLNFEKYKKIKTYFARNFNTSDLYFKSQYFQLRVLKIKTIIYNDRYLTFID